LARRSDAERYESAIVSRLAKGDVDGALEVLEESEIESSKVRRAAIDAFAATKRVETLASALAAAAAEAADDASLPSSSGGVPPKKASRNNRLARKLLAPRFGFEAVGRFSSRKRLELPDVEDERIAELSVAVFAAATAAASALSLGFDALFGLDPTLPDVALAALFGGFGLDAWGNEGKYVGLATAGFDRLLATDPDREAEGQAAAFMVGYLIGIPAFPFAPTAFEGLRVLDASSSRADDVLVWLAAPLAAEAQKHRKFLVADPRQPLAFLRIAEDRGVELMADSAAAPGPPADALSESLKGGFDALKSAFFGKTRPTSSSSSSPTDEDAPSRRRRRPATPPPDGDEASSEQRDDPGAPNRVDPRVRLAWAAAEANELLTRYASLYAKLAEYFRSQAATAGDCVALIEAAASSSPPGPPSSSSGPPSLLATSPSASSSSSRPTP